MKKGFKQILAKSFIAFALASGMTVSVVNIPVYAKTAVKKVKSNNKTIKLKTITLKVGKSKTISAKSKSKVKWSTSNKKVATVKSISKAKVKITAKKAGSTTISGKNKSQKWSFKVTVKEKSTKEILDDLNNESVVAKAKRLLKVKAKAILNESGAAQGTSKMQKFARLCRWWNNNITYDFNETSDNYYVGPWLNKYGDKNNLSESMDTNLLSTIRIVELHKGVCGNQAEAIVYFCKLLGIKAKTADYKDHFHLSNHIYFDDGWYAFDPVELNRYKNQYGQQNIYVSINDLMKSNDYKNSNSYGKQDEEIRQNLLSKGKSTADLDARINRRNHLLVYHLAWTYTVNDYDSDDYLIPAYAHSRSGNKDSSDISSELNGKKYVNTCLNDYL